MGADKFHRPVWPFPSRSIAVAERPSPTARAAGPPGSAAGSGWQVAVRSCGLGRVLCFPPKEILVTTWQLDYTWALRWLKLKHSDTKIAFPLFLQVPIICFSFFFLISSMTGNVIITQLVCVCVCMLWPTWYIPCFIYWWWWRVC